MSLKDKLIKNTAYYIVSQLFGFTLPLILTPIIIAKIGTVEFGIYAILMGFTGAFGILDLGVSASFIKYITEYNIKGKTAELSKFISTGFLFYVIFSLAVIVPSYFLAMSFLSLFSITGELMNLAVYAFRLSLITFFFSNITTIFTCVLFSTQNIRKTSIIGIFLHILNFASALYLLEKGWGLIGLFYVQAGFSLAVLFLNYAYARVSLPNAKISPRNFDAAALKEMFRFGTQIQVSRISILLAEKFDEFLLGAFTSLTNVTYFNSASKIAKASRFFPLQLIPQLGTASAVLHTKEESAKLKELFESFTKFLLMFSLPLLSFIFIFSGELIYTWLGSGFETAAYILKILCIGQLAYLVFSIPGNSILPSMGLPKYIMHEGLITLILNVGLTYSFVMIYGVNGAAIGTTIAVFISSSYLFYRSYNAMKFTGIAAVKDMFLKPAIVCAVLGGTFYFVNKSLVSGFIAGAGRISSILVLAAAGLIYTALFVIIVYYLKYLSSEERSLLKRIFSKFVPFIKPEPVNN